jgi:acetylornithine deacetylase
MIPDQCSFYVDVRTTPAYTHAELAAMVSNLVESRVEIHSDRLVPVDTGHDERIVRATLAALPGSSPAGSPTLSDWIFLADVPAVKIGPGHSEKSHTAREHITLTDLSSGVEAYRRIIVQYFQTLP